MRFGFFLCAMLACAPALAQDTKKEIQKYQQMIADGSPHMPRLGYSGTLTPEQIKDLVGLLLDPESPVNKQ